MEHNTADPAPSAPAAHDTLPRAGRRSSSARAACCCWSGAATPAMQTEINVRRPARWNAGSRSRAGRLITEVSTGHRGEVRSGQVTAVRSGSVRSVQAGSGEFNSSRDG